MKPLKNLQKDSFKNMILKRDKERKVTLPQLADTVLAEAPENRFDVRNLKFSYTEDHPIFEGYVFNWMTSDEFADYLRKKGYRVQENISYEVWKNGINS